MIKIVPYQDSFQSKIDLMLSEISLEFTEPITLPIQKLVTLPTPYWVALYNSEVVGTVALLKKNNYAILKKMMLIKAFRGKEFGISSLLLNTAINWSKQHQIKHLFLGTMKQFTAAQNFYEKNSFKLISETELPKDFIHNPLDSVFYRLDL